MKTYRNIIIIILLLCIKSYAHAQNIEIHNFDELVNSNPKNGDTLTFLNDLNSDSTIGYHFWNLDITFEGDNHYINGNEEFGGFVLNKDSVFNRVGVRNCQGQIYNNSKFAGAVFNSGGYTNIEESGFIGNFVDSGGYNFAVAGAVYNLNGGTIDINNSLFQENYSRGASSFGGAVVNGYLEGPDAMMTINNSIFFNNNCEGSVIPYGGAIYNDGILSINNTRFEKNHVLGKKSFYQLGGAIYNNLGDVRITNSNIIENYIDGGDTSITRGGAIYNNKNMTIDNTLIKGNYIKSDNYANGGAVCNDYMGTLKIKNSLIEDNHLTGNAITANGGAIFNANKLIIDNTTLRNNYSKDGRLNDIHNDSSGEIDFVSDGITNILSGISGSGNIYKKDSGTLNLGGKNDEYTGNFTFEQGTVNLLKNGSYFKAENTNFGNEINFNMQNGELNNINFGNLTLDGKANIFADVNFNNNQMDMINANSINGSGSLFVENLAFQGTPKGDYITIPFADSVLKDYVQYNSRTIHTPIYDYYSSYDASDGNFDFQRRGFNSAVLAPAVAAQLAGYLTQIDTYKNVFSNLDMVMISPPDRRQGGLKYYNKTANAAGNIAYSPLLMPEQRNGVWFKPYTTFENVPLRHGPRVSNVSYGSMIGVESDLQRLKNNWYNLYGGYASYNGSHQAYDGNGIYNNGGLLGAYAVFYKGKLFSAWTANVGANVAEASTNFGRDNFAMLNTGIAQKTGYNFETLERRLIIQPSIIASYSFVDTFNYTNAANVHINTEPLHALHIEPQIKFIGNFKDYLQPYISVSMVWNIIDHARFRANDVYLPDLSVKPFVQYGAGVQKRWGERVTGFFEGMIRNGGRNGIALQFGLRISI